MPNEERNDKIEPKEEEKVEESSNEVKEEAASATPETTEETKPEATEEAKPAAPAERPKSAFSRGGRPQQEESDMVERVVKINRVSKVVKGGKNFSFSALVVTGDGDGQVGVGFGKSNEVVDSIKKGAMKSKRNFVKVNRAGDTIPHEVIGRYKASRVLMKPAGPGTGVIAGGPVRAICDAVGIKNILTKTLGSRNAVNVVKATIDGFQKLRLKRRG